MNSCQRECADFDDESAAHHQDRTAQAETTKGSPREQCSRALLPARIWCCSLLLSQAPGIRESGIRRAFSLKSQSLEPSHFDRQAKTNDCKV